MALSRSEILQRVPRGSRRRQTRGRLRRRRRDLRQERRGRRADLIIIYNSGRYRMAGRGSLAGLMPYGDANGIVVEMAAEVLPVVTNTPVLAGICGTIRSALCRCSSSS